MAYAIAGILLAAWLVGLATSTVVGGYIHILLLLSIITVIANLVYQEKKS